MRLIMLRLARLGEAVPYQLWRTLNLGSEDSPDLTATLIVYPSHILLTINTENRRSNGSTMYLVYNGFNIFCPGLVSFHLQTPFVTISYVFLDNHLGIHPSCLQPVSRSLSPRKARSPPSPSTYLRSSMPSPKTYTTALHVCCEK